ncbi:MAG: hypothetical protein WA056_08410 [Gallionella sp.]
MRTLGALLLVLFSTNLSAATFAERVAIAKKIESQQATQDYFLKGLFPVIGPAMGGIMNECLSHTDASVEKFTLVANVAESGQLVDIDVEPKSNNTAVCFAKAFATLTAPPPPLCDCGVLPVVIDMGVKP